MPVGPEGLEERQLGLDAHDVRRHGVHDPAAEPSARLGRGGPAGMAGAAELDRKELESGVETDDELAALGLDSAGQPVAEGADRRNGGCADLARHTSGMYATRPAAPASNGDGRPHRLAAGRPGAAVPGRAPGRRRPCARRGPPRASAAGRAAPLRHVRPVNARCSGRVGVPRSSAQVAEAESLAAPG